MRIAYLSQDRADLQVTVKELSSKMCSPSRDHMKRFQRVGQYLVKVPCVVATFGNQQVMPTAITVHEDADHAECPLTRRSTNAAVTQHGTSTLRCQSTWQSTQHGIKRVLCHSQGHCSSDVLCGTGKKVWDAAVA
eukprot:2404346-Amphidinium_carterae.2